MSALLTRPSETPSRGSVASVTLSVVVPLYRSEGTVGPLVERLIEVLEPEYPRLEIVLVNDGSPDTTHERVVELCQHYPRHIKYIRLARNFGEHNAVMCGLRHATGDAVAIIDDDFQNPPEEILKLVAKLREGYDVVYGHYAAKKHSFFRNLGSRFANAVACWMLKKPRRLYLSSFKVLDGFLVRVVTEYSGPYPYVDGLVLRSTGSIASVLVRHEERLEGQSNYTLRRLVRLWLNMFTGFSVLPLRIASLFGLAMSVFGVFLAGFFILSWSLGGIFFDRPFPPGWASLIVTVVLFAGIQLCVLGVLGEYLGRLFLTQNRQPQFIVREIINPAQADSEEKVTNGRVQG